MESAIPGHLRCERLRHRRISDDFEPPSPAYVARHAPNVTRVIMAYFGIQYEDTRDVDPTAALDWITSRFGAEGGPSHWDRARYVDEAGFVNVVSVAYWDHQPTFQTWFAGVREGWTGDDLHLGGIGRFIEVLSPAVEGYETLVSSIGNLEGVAVLAGELSGEVQEHGYWGGMRDRFPRSQTSEMTPDGSISVVRDGSRTRVVPHDNLCLIRSGQDWIDTEGTERDMYFKDVEPILRAGMDFLRDDGAAIGCYANRYMTVLAPDGSTIEKSYGMSWWNNLASLERWAESHPTHLRIFSVAMKYLSEFGSNAKLRLYHEVTVARAEEQFFEYADCHGQTGMLKAIEAVPRT